MSTTEIIAAIFGFGAVAATIVRSPWCWPLGLVQVVLYVGVFYDAKLYSDMLLHIVFVALQFYGWFQWYRSPLPGQAIATRIHVETLGSRELTAAITTSIFISLVIGAIMWRYTDAEWPFADAFIAGTSLVAQYLLAHKKLENWYLWIAIDLVAIVVFAAKGLIPTTCLYVLFLIMAIGGAQVWYKQLREVKPA